ncbi:MAG: hypothetical protein A3H42_03820 [Deltaproteobacteria bacterium RIFCSPLOWO2_02_FULL_46_8]|nr:MAG: hypothetical protein A3H42_03820 [Deltaproteobacteria bacterium RIFCSPLOWO2_02_FULL_46_8]
MEFPRVESPPSPKEQMDKYFAGQTPEWHDNPMGLAMKLSHEGMADQQYQELIPKLEAKCLQNIPLMQQWQIALRGDTVEPETLAQHPPILLSTVTSMVWNRLDVEVPGRELYVLGELMDQVLKRAGRAWFYEYNRKIKHLTPEIPSIIYTFGKPLQGEIDKMYESHYFIGATDDIGINVDTPFVLPLPPTTQWDGRQSKEAGELFPQYGPILGRHEWSAIADRRRMDRFNRQPMLGYRGEQPTRAGKLWQNSLSHPRCYFNAALASYHLLRHLLNFSKQQAEKQKE